MSELQRKPSWLKIRPPGGEAYQRIKGLRQGLKLATVCEEAACPNVAECWGGGTATFMLLGDTCTRGCRFCNVKTGNPHGVVDAAEPENLLAAVRAMELDYVVLTMVDRDDLEDGGAAHVAACIRTLAAGLPELKIEILTGDFRGRADAVRTVVDSGCHVFAHNVETVERLTPSVRDRRSGYRQTLSVLQHAKSLDAALITKSSIMLGLGETDAEVETTLQDLLDHGVGVVTLGQYLQPNRKLLPVAEWIAPERFDAWRVRAEEMGFLYCASGPLVRSSYRAGELFLSRHLAVRGSGEG